MEENNKRRTVSRKGILLICLMLLVSSLAACDFGGVKTPDGEEPQTSDYYISDAEPEQEALPPVRVEMRDYELSYSGELESVIVFEQQADSNDLAFYVSLSDGRAPIFTLRFNSDEGDYVTVLRDSAGSKLPVAFRMETIPEGLSEEDRKLFFTAQDAVNEIAASLVVK